MLLCFVGGFFMGRAGVGLQDSIDAINWTGVAQKLYVPATIILVAVVVITFLVCCLMFAGVRKGLTQIEKLDDEEYEEKLTELEKKLAIIITVAGVVEYVTFILYPLIILCLETMRKGDVSFSGSTFMVANGFFLLEMAFYMAVNALVVNQEKKLNPEKNGNVFDLRFRRQWYDSMDEAEILKAAKASQSAYIVGIYTGFVLWIIAFVAMLLFHTGILPVALVSIMMLVMFLVAAVKSI
jgi:hypothetical protein